ncbi:hypothetical protein GCM10007235_07960 [Pseudoxanthomonas indica]|nr:hypothetical protein GCM10007235_07960 [Pseudoxanthomonas indica]
MTCCMASLSTPSWAPIAGKAGKMVSIENGPNIANPPSNRARRRCESGLLGAVMGGSIRMAGKGRGGGEALLERQNGPARALTGRSGG